MSEQVERRGRPLSSKWSVEVGFRFPLRVGNNLYKYRHIILNQDDDFCIIVDGDEGAGKSHAALQIAYFLDIDKWEYIDAKNPDTGEQLKKPVYGPEGRHLSMDQVCFTKEQVFNAIRDLPPGKAIVFDEAARSTDRRKAMDDDNITFNQMMREARQFNKFIVIVHQSFYDMDMQMAVRRSTSLINFRKQFKKGEGAVVEYAPLKRGAARFYTKEGKKELYMNQHLRKSFRYPLIKNESFDVEFGYHWVVDEEEYKKKKAKAADDLEGKKKPKCPECGSAVYYNRTKQETNCRVCPWSGTLTKDSNTHKNTGEE